MCDSTQQFLKVLEAVANRLRLRWYTDTQTSVSMLWFFHLDCEWGHPFSVSLPDGACNNDSSPESPDATSTTKTRPPGEPQPSGTPEHVTEGGHTHENLVRSKLDVFSSLTSLLPYSLTLLILGMVSHHAQYHIFGKYCVVIVIIRSA